MVNGYFYIVEDDEDWAPIVYAAWATGSWHSYVVFPRSWQHYVCVCEATDPYSPCADCEVK